MRRTDRQRWWILQQNRFNASVQAHIRIAKSSHGPRSTQIRTSRFLHPHSIQVSRRMPRSAKTAAPTVLESTQVKQGANAYYNYTIICASIVPLIFLETAQARVAAHLLASKLWPNRTFSLRVAFRIQGCWPTYAQEPSRDTWRQTGETHRGSVTVPPRARSQGSARNIHIADRLAGLGQLISYYQHLSENGKS